MKLNLLFLGTLIVYSLLSKIIFDNVYLASKLIIDEEFHLPLGKQYCHFNFGQWNPKVTTLPGLYLLSALLLGPVGLCSLYWLRITSLFCSCINLLLFYLIFSENVERNWQKAFLALTISLLPPLYFFSHVYYTDVVSLTTTLLMIVLSEKRHHYSASIAGFLSILTRQTNVIFVAIYGGKYIITELYNVWIVNRWLFREKGSLQDGNVMVMFIYDCLKYPITILKGTKLKIWLNFLCYTSVIVFFMVFVWLNGGIVVGDRSAHQVSIHVPQLFYFSVFCLVFGWPHFISEISNFMLSTKRHKVLTCIFALIILSVIHYNTIVHPYLLADNRHFVFYVWNRFYGKFWWFRYAMTPIYMFCLYALFNIIWNQSDIGFLLLYIPGVVLLLTTQSLLEFRYFLLPYVILRLKIQNYNSAVFKVVLEFITYCIINLMVFNIFFTKTFLDGYSFPQRIIW